MKFLTMKSKLGRRRFVIIEDFTWCERKYLEWFRGYIYVTQTKRHQATVKNYDNMVIRYKDKHEILFKPSKGNYNIKEDL